jgi:hypothetical protein
MPVLSSLNSTRVTFALRDRLTREAPDIPVGSASKQHIADRTQVNT